MYLDKKVQVNNSQIQIPLTSTDIHSVFTKTLEERGKPYQDKFDLTQVIEVSVMGLPIKAKMITLHVRSPEDKTIIIDCETPPGASSGEVEAKLRIL